MSISRRKLIGGGVAAVAGAAGLTRLAEQQGLIPPDSGCLYGTGTTLTRPSRVARRIAARFPLQARRQARDRLQTLQIRRQTLGIVRNAAISRRAVKLRSARRLPQLPYQRVLAPAAS